MRQIRVRCVAGQRLFADALAHRLGREPDMVLVPPGTADGVDASIELPGALDPDDDRAGDPPVIVLSSTGDERCAVAAARGGAVGWLDRRCGIDELLTAVRAVAAGQTHYPHDVHAAVVAALRDGGRDEPEPGLLARLTNREREVLRALADGHENREIGEVLGMSYNTVRTHTNEIFRKLGVHNRVEAVRVLWAAP